MDVIMAIIFVGLIIHGIKKNQESQKKRSQKKTPEEKPIAYVNTEHPKEVKETRYVRIDDPKSPKKADKTKWDKTVDEYKKRAMKGPLQELVTALEELADAGKNVIEKQDAKGSSKPSVQPSSKERSQHVKNKRQDKYERRKPRSTSRLQKKTAPKEADDVIDLEVSENYTPRLTTMKKSRYANRGLKIEVEDIDGDVQNKQMTTLAFDGDSVVKGVIWKEILDKRVS